MEKIHASGKNRYFLEETGQNWSFLSKMIKQICYVRDNVNDKETDILQTALYSLREPESSYKLQKDTHIYIHCTQKSLDVLCYFFDMKLL